MEEMRIKSKKEKLKLQMKIAEAEAKINALTESQFLHSQTSNITTSSRTSTEYIVPMTTKRVQTKHRAYSDQNSTNDDDSLTDVMKRQNVITELLIKQSALSQLSQREICLSWRPTAVQIFHTIF